ncbi:MAG TPA: TetR/AcrR family transcriptional regulator [Deltaproteobacteria bacterium]|nr:TetR/AcrR family transcriptional regulator [Deltaproteobacteria bacterium]HOM30187.1 TetR/AcrR family transcriptional regulator [Deltaproteobacteria bacterium]HPP81895.1 TetR/AcrR family transcriptional regulator [Deltaproteobacteria bacterium]
MKRLTKRELRVEAIYKAALKVFAAYGFRKATIEDIANELGVGKSSLYFYVRDKRELYEKAVAYGLTRWQDKVRKAVADEPDPERKFVVMAKKAYEHLVEDQDLRRILERDPSLFPLDESRDPYAHINRASMNMIREVLANAIDAGRFRSVDLDAVPQLLFAVYVMLVQKAYMFGQGPLAGIMFEDGLDIVLDGLRKPGR